MVARTVGCGGLRAVRNFPGDPSGPNMGADGGQSIFGRLANQIEVDRSLILNWREVLTRPGYLIFKILLRPGVAEVKFGRIFRLILSK